MKRITHIILGVAVCVFIVTQPIIYGRLGALNSPVIIFYSGIFISLIFLVNIFHSLNIPERKKGLLIISILDLAIIVYLLWGILNLLFFNRIGVNIIWLKWLNLFCLYMLFRINDYEKYVISALSISGLVQSLLVIVQRLGYTNSHHMFFEVTGSFNNPGPLGGYLAVSFLASVLLVLQSVKRTHNKFVTVAYFINSIIIATSLWLADSRAAFVAIITSVVYLSWPKIKNIIWRKRLLSVIFVIIPIFAGSLLLYNHRPDSIKGRLLIWTVSLEMCKHKPITGHGIGSFSQQYMLSQSEYFNNNIDSSYGSYADDNFYAFNDFLKILTEQGLPGLALYLFIIVVALKNGNKNRKISVLFICLLVFSLFSYPADIFPLLTLYPMFLGNVKSKVIRDMPICCNVVRCGVLIISVI